MVYLLTSRAIYVHRAEPPASHSRVRRVTRTPHNSNPDLASIVAPPARDATVGPHPPAHGISSTGVSERFSPKAESGLIYLCVCGNEIFIIVPIDLPLRDWIVNLALSI